MTVLILFAAALGTPAPPADSGHCDSKPFTLKKPVAAPKPPPPPKSAPPKSAPAKTAKANKYVPGCQQPKG